MGSITPLMHIDVPRGTNFIDIGTGAGIPGIPLLLYFGGNMKGVLVDSNNKKIKFLLNAIETLGITNIVTVIQGRVEEIAKKKHIGIILILLCPVLLLTRLWHWSMDCPL